MDSRRHPLRAARLLAAAVCLAGLAPARASAQSSRAIEAAAGGVRVGSDLDDYLRYLESLGRTPLVPWGLRGFAPSVVDSLTAIKGAHPWARDRVFERPSRPEHVRVLPIDITERFNSAYPFGINEGPVWAGRGITSAVSAGLAFAAGPLSATIHPILFRAENTAFPLRPNGRTGDSAFADPVWPDHIDRPQRFGSSAYTHFDPGETTIRLDFAGVSVAATSANEWWGPASTFPTIVGNNAAGVPRITIGTRGPTNIYIGKIQARVEYGLEAQSKWSTTVGPDTFASPDSAGRTRFMSGLTVTFSPGIFPGLEIDASRYFHQAWFGHIDGSLLRTPFQGILKSSIPRGPSIPGIDDRDALKNQLASVGFRWVLPHSGFDVYGEYAREDYAENSRALAVQPDLSRFFMLGMRKAFQHADSTRIDAVRAEIFNSDPTTMGLYRSEGRTYVHYPLRQGHTEEGKVIGAGVGVGAPAAATFAWDRFTPTGRTTVYLLKMSENTSSDLPSDPHTTAAAGADALRFTTFGSASVGAAVVRTNRVRQGWGGWDLALTAGVALRVP